MSKSTTDTLVDVDSLVASMNPTIDRPTDQEIESSLTRVQARIDADRTPSAGRTVGALVATSRLKIVVGGSGALAAAAAATVLSVGALTGAPPAYAMTQNADGSVTVTINDVANSVTSLNARFAAMGIDEVVVPVEAGCQGTGNLGDELQLSPEASMTDTLTFVPGRKYLEPGYTGVIAAEQLPDGQVATTMEAIASPIPTCFPTTAVKMVQTGDANGVPTITAQTLTPERELNLVSAGSSRASHQGRQTKPRTGV